MRNSVKLLVVGTALLLALTPAPALASLSRIAGPTPVAWDGGTVDMIDVAFDSVNQVYLAVWGTFAYGPTKGQFMNSSGTPIGATFTISDGVPQAGWARVVFGGGKFLVSYTKILGGNTHRRSAKFVTYQGGAASLSSEIEIDTWVGGAGSASGMAYSNGRFLLTWWNWDNTPPQSFVTILDGSGTYLAYKVHVSTFGDGQTDPEIACDPARGRCLIVGQQWGVFNPGVTPGTWGQFISDSDATRIGPGFTVSYGSIQKEASVAYSAAGDRYVVTFSRSQNTVHGLRIGGASMTVIDEFVLRSAEMSPEGAGYGLPIVAYNPTTQTSMVAMMPWIGRTAVIELDASGTTVANTFQFVPGVEPANYNAGTKEVAPAADPANGRFLVADIQAFQHMRSTVFSSAPAAPPCAGALSSGSEGFALTGGGGTFTVTTTPAGCDWNVSAGASWISVSGASSRTGSGTVSYTVAANSGLARTGTISVAGQTYSVRQAGFIPTARRFDINQDGHTDLLWQNRATGELAVWRMNGLSVAASTALVPGIVADTGWKVAGSSDMNGDGYSDLIWQHDNGYVAVWWMRGDVMISGELITPSPLVDTSWRIVATGDLDRDGWNDLLWQHTSGQVAVWYMRGRQMLAGEPIGNMGNPNWLVEGADDFNGDGRLDLVLRNNADGEIAVWLLNDRVIQSSVSVSPTVPNINWQIAGTGDHNADGRPDLLWRNRTTGELAVWFMRGVTLIGAAAPTPGVVPNTSWRVVGPR